MSRSYTIALGLALCAGAAMTANAQAASTATKADTTAITRHHDRREMRREMRRGAGERGDNALFKGIDLSSAQKAKVDSIRSRYRSESKSLREQMAPDMKNARAARQSGDSAKINEARESMAASREKMMTLRKQEMSEIRGALTPEQQSTFDKNAEQLKGRLRDARDAHKGARSGRSAR